MKFNWREEFAASINLSMHNKLIDVIIVPLFLRRNIDLLSIKVPIYIRWLES